MTGRDRSDDGAASDGERPQSRRPDLEEARRAVRRDLDASVYARRRRRDRGRRHRLERAIDDPAPDDDAWTIPDRSGRRRMPGTPEALGDVLGSMMEERGWSERVRSSVLFARWPEVVGDDVARNCTPVRLVGGVLVVATTSTSWATQLTYLAPELQRAVNRALGEPVVDRVEVQVRR